MLKIIRSLVFLFLFFAFAKSVYAANLGDVLITEIKIGEAGATNNEFIELFNKSNQDIDLTGWILKKKTKSGSESNLISPSKFIGTIKANGFLLIAHPIHKDAIQADLAYSGNSYSIAGDNTVILYDVDEKIIDKVGYGEAMDFFGAVAVNPDEGQSLSRKFIDGAFVDTKNNLTDFEILITPNPQNSSSLIANQPVSNNNPPASGISGTQTQTADTASTQNILSQNDISDTNLDNSSDIMISEIFPNPVRGDTGEWIELYNKGGKEAVLTGWRVGDDSGQQYRIATGTIIKAYDFLAIFRQDSKIILDNPGDSVKLYKPSRVTAVETIKYKNAFEGQSYARDLNVKNRWLWTADVTPGGENIVEPANSAPSITLDFPAEASVRQPVIFDCSDSFDEDGDVLGFMWDFGDGAESSLETAEHTYWKAGTFTVSLTANDGKTEVKKEKKIKILGHPTSKDVGGKAVKVVTVKKTSAKKIASSKTTPADLAIGDENLAVGASKKMTGVVVVLPGVFGTQYFYMTGDPGIQIYNYKKDFPALKVGDKIEVNGTISDNNGEARLKTKARIDMKILENVGEPQAVSMSGNEIGSETANQLIQIKGEIAGKKGQSVFIDDGDAEVEAYIKKGTGIAMGLFKVGKPVTLTGLVVRHNDAYRVMPRSIGDVNTDEAGEVLGESAVSDEWAIAERDKKKELINYLAIIFGGVVVVGGVFLFRYYRESRNRVNKNVFQREEVEEEVVKLKD